MVAVGSRRFEQLDSLRGLAAVTVVVCHCLNLPSALDRTWVRWALERTPLGLVQAGHEAVVLFFVLSGFVLSLPFLRGPAPYRAFLIKRICRIWLPYCGALLLALLMWRLTSRGAVPELGAWFNRPWVRPMSWGLVGQHFALIGSFRNNALNPALWSLVHEMRMSILFPLVMLAVLRLPWRACLGLALGVSFLGFAGNRLTANLHWSNDYFLTARFAAMFLVGGLLAKHREMLVARLAAWPAAGQWLAVGFAVLGYTSTFWLGHNFHVPGMLLDWLITGGSAFFIIGALASAGATRFLTTRPLLFLGRTSYSIYLLHAICLLTLVHLFHRLLPMPLLWAMTLTSALLLSALYYRWVELPSIGLGRVLTKARSAAGPEASEELTSLPTKSSSP